MKRNKEIRTRTIKATHDIKKIEQEVKKEERKLENDSLLKKGKKRRSFYQF